MTALAAPRKTTTQRGQGALADLQSVPVADNVKIYAGALVVLSSGYAAPGSTATGLIAIGRAEADADNTGAGHAAGAINVLVRRGVFKFANSSAGDLIAQADVGADCYIVDDQTVAKTNGSSTRSRAGKVFAVASDGVEVQIGLGV